MRSRFSLLYVQTIRSLLKLFIYLCNDFIIKQYLYISEISKIPILSKIHLLMLFCINLFK